MYKSYFLDPAYRLWSWGGVCLILALTIAFIYIQLQLNTLYGDFFDGLQLALRTPSDSNIKTQYTLLFYWACFSIGNAIIYPAQIYFRNRWSFQWRQAMANYYTANWAKICHIEGVSQRVQENTNRFSWTLETLVTRFVRSTLTLVMFVPLLWQLSAQVISLPFIGPVSNVAVYTVLIVSLCSTVSLSLIGRKLPSYQFATQIAEAAYRKSLTGQEDNIIEDPKETPTLFKSVKNSYLVLFYHQMYFEACKGSFLQISSLAPYVVLMPTLLTGVITFGVFQQITYTYTRVAAALELPISSSNEIIQVIAEYRRLRPLDQAIKDYDSKLAAGVA
jgi:peptide/bleomycin uptake transporter